MTVTNNKIVSATERELRQHWISRELDDVYSFSEYLEQMKQCGVTIEEEAQNG